jgi:membrane dipeptidase
MRIKSPRGFTAAVLLVLFSCNTDYSGEKGAEKAGRLHRSLLTIDSHTDTPLRLFRPGTDLSVRSDPSRGGGKLDFPRMEEGGLDGVFFAVFVGQRKRTPEGNAYARDRALQLFDSIHAIVARNPQLAEIARSSSDLRAINRRGKKAVYIGIENGFTLGRDLSLISRFYNLGARYITLCHSSNNDICDSSTDEGGPEHGGLSAFGREVVAEMNRLGIMVDVSHISDQAFYDVVAISNAPVIASHSDAREICHNPRNLGDSMLLKLAENGGVIQLSVLSNYVAETEPDPQRDSARQAVMDRYGDWEMLDDSTRNLMYAEWSSLDEKYPPDLATVSQFCDHVDHIVNLIGIDHVGFGSDFDGGGGLADCFDESQLPNITLELLRRGYSRSDLQKFWSGNLLRVMQEVERAAAASLSYPPPRKRHISDKAPNKIRESGALSKQEPTFCRR